MQTVNLFSCTNKIEQKLQEIIWLMKKLQA